MIINSDDFSIYFGNKFGSHKAFGDIAPRLRAKSLVFLQQVHGTGHQYIGAHHDSYFESGKRTGDILCTDVSACAIGVLTADCLPIVFYDPEHHVCAVAHAGWKGAVAGVVQKTVLLLAQRFHARADKLSVYFGPSAQACCYEVSDDFYRHVAECYHQHVFVRKNKKLLFDNTALNYLQLVDAGVLPGHICKDQNVCTICDPSYHSYRRDGKTYRHQATIVVLKERICPS